MPPEENAVLKKELELTVMSTKAVSILGTRGVPAAHSGFETLAERLSRYLVEMGWDVTVYCQAAEAVDGKIDQWEGIRRVTFGSSATGPLSTIIFDWMSTRHAANEPSLKLILGYNTACFAALLKLKGRKVIVHTDGLEWLRPKWNRLIKVWFYLNFHCGNFLGDRIVADHPALIRHFANVFNRKKMSMISYGADPVLTHSSDYIRSLALEPDRYFTVIARVEPDNNILTIVKAFSTKRRGYKLVVLGTFDERKKYHRDIKEAASPEVLFLGPIYDAPRVQELRYHSRAYIHGHFVGGTNPSLVEALWAGNAVIAHRNEFNEWTAGPNQFFFGSVAECSDAIDLVIADEVAVQRARKSGKAWAEQTFSWPAQLEAYQALMEDLRQGRQALEFQ
jgi:glycosyltransferase involved in cell wall biosynthesis